MTDPRIVFAGTPEFALASLSALVNANRNVVAVYTQPDRPAGRGRKLSASPVKQFAETRGITVMQPTSLREDIAIAELEALRPDILVVAAYGLILPQAVLDVPTTTCVNVHASLLPRWRGAAPIQAAILAGDDKTGVSLMQMTAGLDCGPVYVTSSIALGGEETAETLHKTLASMGAELLHRELNDILLGNLAANAQDDALATYAGKILSTDAELDWSLSAAELHRRIRAYNPNPGAYFIRTVGADSLRIKVWGASVRADVVGEPGTFVQYDRDGVVIACGVGGLELELLQRPGKARTTAREFASQVDLST